MEKYRKKPVVVEAERFLPKLLDGYITTSGYYIKPYSIYGVKERFFRRGFWIKTLEGWMKLNLGDWIIKGVKGEFYPCKPDIFKETYEKVDE